MANTLAASDADEPPQNINQPPPSFSSLPKDIIPEILARVPKRYHPILSCVSKNFRNLVPSPAIQKIRSSLGRESLYICFMETVNHLTGRWFTLRRVKTNPIEDQFAAVDIKFPNNSYGSVIAVGPEIFFIVGSYSYSSSSWFFDSKSGMVRQGPSLRMDRLYNTMGLVGSKIYVIGRNRDRSIEAESFNLKTQTREPAPIPRDEGSSTVWITGVSASLNRKVFALSFYYKVAACYDTRDGSCSRFDLPDDKSWRTSVSVVKNVLYVYYAKLGLMWYDFERTIWREVTGLDHLNNVESVGMDEYYGKLAILWVKSSDVGSDTKEIWCRMVGLERSEDGINGIAEASQHLGNVPSRYKLFHCLSVSD